MGRETKGSILSLYTQVNLIILIRLLDLYVSSILVQFHFKKDQAMFHELIHPNWYLIISCISWKFIEQIDYDIVLY